MTTLKAGINNVENIEEVLNMDTNIFKEVIDNNTEYVDSNIFNISYDDNETNDIDERINRIEAEFEKQVDILFTNANDNMIISFTSYLTPDQVVAFENDFKTLSILYKDINNILDFEFNDIQKDQMKDRILDLENSEPKDLILNMLDIALGVKPYSNELKSMINITYNNKERVYPIINRFITSGFLYTDIDFLNKLAKLVDKYHDIYSKSDTCEQTQLRKLIYDLENIDELIKERAKNNNPYETTFKDFFERLKKRLKDNTEELNRIKLVQTKYSISNGNNALQIVGDKDNPNIVISPIGDSKVKIQAFYGPIYMDSETYPEIDTKLEIGLAVTMDDFIRYGNGYGINLKKDGTIAI